MKNLSFLVSLSFLLVSCSVQKRASPVQVLHKQKSDYPVLTSKAEHFDMSAFDKRKTEVSITRRDTVYQHYDQQSYYEEDTKRNLLKSFSRSSDSGIIDGYDYSVNPVIGIYKEFFPDGQIRLKGMFCYYGFRMGKWFSYNQEGLLTGTTDYDSCYAFTTKDILSFCKKNRIPLKKVMFGHRTSIYKKKTPDGNCIWVIRYPRQDIFYYFTVVIDASNGKVLSTTRSPFPREE
ncbi:MAG: hypothetical protein EOP45_21430 [Sphingobacteriaceae bacterium]|nr:MAG: hypothetical protein EOP45_21430 [Sphingobacteriaceae bacterium]